MTVKHIAVVYPAGGQRGTEQETELNFERVRKKDFLLTEIKPELASLDGYTSAPPLERAAQLSFALTSRKFDIIAAGRGGAGSTELVPFLENLLPPVLPKKTLVGFSDISFLGVYLALRFPNLRYIHGSLFSNADPLPQNQTDFETLFATLHNEICVQEFKNVVTFCSKKNLSQKLSGPCIPLNLSLAECVAAHHFLELPKGNILFIEECHEHLYRIIRKLDNLINSGLLKNTQALVVGTFIGCQDAKGDPLERKMLLELVARKTRLPTYDLPIFGHGPERFPLVMNARIEIEQNQESALIQISNQAQESHAIATQFSPHLFQVSQPRAAVHLTGIGGTGMAQVAGLFAKSGYHVTGSDNPIYPPMDKLIKDLHIEPEVGFFAKNIQKTSPDMIILANAVGRKSANLTKNEELEEILNQNIPVLSFPSALRKYFLAHSKNIIVSGTHGKTTTSSLVSFLLSELHLNPSFLIGGQPANFDAGYQLGARNLFVLEGDEYDSAFFDKGPKFLHYEPSICLINNIEFDHADIYADIEAIEDEFLRLARLTKDRNGIVIANLDDPRVVRVAQTSQAKVIGFSKKTNTTFPFPCWVLNSYQTGSTDTEIKGTAPDGHPISFQTGIFGEHNALNAIAACATVEAYFTMSGNPHSGPALHAQLASILPRFRGVKRRFELLAEKNNIAVFDDFAHHPTAIATTLHAFRDYMKSSSKKGNLIVCFDPKNATMRRNILQTELAQSLSPADRIYLGKIPVDQRMAADEVLNGPKVVQMHGEKGRYFDDNQVLLQTLKQEVKSGDIVVFMSSGSFDGIPHRFAEVIQNDAK